MNIIWRYQLHKPYPKLSPFDIYPKLTIFAGIAVAIALIGLFIIKLHYYG